MDVIAVELEAKNDKKPVVVVGGGDEAKNTAIAATESTRKLKNKNRIHVSNTKRPLYFYCNLAKRFIKQYNDVELTALGMAIPTVITISEILKRTGLAVEKKISISTVAGSKDEEKGRIVQKPQIEILLGKAEKLEQTAVAAA